MKYSYYFFLSLMLLFSACEKNDPEAKEETRFKNFDPSILFSFGDYSEICSLTDSLPAAENDGLYKDGSYASYIVPLDDSWVNAYVVAVFVFESVADAKLELNWRIKDDGRPPVMDSLVSNILDDAVFLEHSNSAVTDMDLYVQRSNVLTIFGSTESVHPPIHCSHDLDQLIIFAEELLKNLENPLVHMP